MGMMADGWRQFVTMVFGGETISKAQYQEMRRCFFAGYIEAVQMIAEIPLGMSAEEKQRMSDSLKAEMKEFMQEIKMRIDEGKY